MSQMNNEVFFRWLLVILMFTFVKCPFRLLAHFSVFVFFFFNEYKDYFNELNSGYMLDMCISDIFFYYMAYIFALLMVALHTMNLLFLTQSNLFIFSFTVGLFISSGVKLSNIVSYIKL